MIVKKETIKVSGKIIGKYSISKKAVKDFNKRYEKVKTHLNSQGPKLAGRLDTELNFLESIQSTEAFKEIVQCMDQYINRCIKYMLLPSKNHHLNISACWVNDMIAGEYNPPHIHQDGTGFSTVLFLKVPTFINDVKNSHKFKDGQLCFIDAPNSCEYCTPYVGDLYIFQADHQHCVMPFKTKNPNEIRRSMSFNFQSIDKPPQEKK